MKQGGHPHVPAVPCRHGALYQARGPQWDTLQTSPINMLIPTGRGGGGTVHNLGRLFGAHVTENPTETDSSEKEH